MCNQSLKSVFDVNGIRSYMTISSVNFSGEITSFSDELFNDCWYLSNITIPETVCEIGERAFGSCSSLTNIKIPEGV